MKIEEATWTLKVTLKTPEPMLTVKSRGDTQGYKIEADKSGFAVKVRDPQGKVIIAYGILGAVSDADPTTIYIGKWDSKEDVPEVVKTLSHETLHAVLGIEGELPASKGLDVISGNQDMIDYSGFMREEFRFVAYAKQRTVWGRVKKWLSRDV